MRARTIVSAFPSLGFFVALLACGGGSNDGAPLDGGNGDTLSGLDGTNGDSGPGFDVGDGAVDGGTYGCSADLRSVTDATGAVVTTCPPDQGCSNGKCIAACDAATASGGNVGCDFLVPTPATYPYDKPPCFAAFVTNAWARPAKISVTRAGTTFDVTAFARIAENDTTADKWKPVPADGIPVGEVGVLFLSGDPTAIFGETGEPMTCPVTPAVNAATSLPSSGVGDAFHVTSDTPVSAYDIIPYGGARSHFPSAQLLFPTQAWGTNYVVTATPKGTDATYGPLWQEILATQDHTTITILPTQDLPAFGSFSAAPAGKAATFTVDAGKWLEWQLPAGSSDLSGTIVSSDKPVAVFAGSRFFRLQLIRTGPGGESTHQQVPPVRTLGSEYVAAPYASRLADLSEETIPYRLVGAIDGTKLTFDPPIAGAPSTIDHAQVVDVSTVGPFRVTSQDKDHPFVFVQLMTSANVADPPGARVGATAPGYGPWLGDEEFLVVQPPQQFLSHYVFFTDPAYPTTNLVITRVKTASGFQDVSIDCLGTIPAASWKDVGTSGLYQVTNVDLVRAAIGVGTCKNGRQVADSKGPIGVIVWGEDSYSSYAYPAGGNAATLTTATVPATPK